MSEHNKEVNSAPLVGGVIAVLCFAAVGYDYFADNELSNLGYAAAGFGSFSAFFALIEYLIQRSQNNNN